MIERLFQKHEIPLRLDYYNSGEQFLFHLENVHPDIVFQDINMPPLDGVETAHHLWEADFAGEIIFLTVSKEHMFDAFGVRPLRYIVKEKIEQIFLRAVKLVEKKKSE